MLTMKKKHFISIVLIATFGLSLVAPSVWAGNVQRNRWEGVAIGIGAALLGSALFNHHMNRSGEREVVYRPPPPHRHRDNFRHRPSGHWEIRKKWIPPDYERVWNPGHYNPNGRWVSGHWIEIEKEPGYWAEERIWVSRKRHRHYDHD